MASNISLLRQNGKRPTYPRSSHQVNKLVQEALLTVDSAKELQGILDALKAHFLKTASVLTAFCNELEKHPGAADLQSRTREVRVKHRLFMDEEMLDTCTDQLPTWVLGWMEDEEDVARRLLYQIEEECWERIDMSNVALEALEVLEFMWKGMLAEDGVGSDVPWYRRLPSPLSTWFNFGDPLAERALDVASHAEELRGLLLRYRSYWHRHASTFAAVNFDSIMQTRGTLSQKVGIRHVHAAWEAVEKARKAMTREEIDAATWFTRLPPGVQTPYSGESSTSSSSTPSNAKLP